MTAKPMTEAEFRSRRRQKFLKKKDFDLNEVELEASWQTMPQTVDRKGAGSKVDSSTQDGIFKNKLKLLRLHYTAGDPIEFLRPLYADALHWFEEWHKAEHVHSAYLAKKTGEDLRLDMPPLEFEDLFHYQLALDMVSLGILLGDGNAIRRAASLMHSTCASDMFMEYLLETVVPDPQDIKTFFHEQPYGALVDAIYTADSPEESAAFVRQHLQGRYNSFEGVPWHDSHLVQTEEHSNYEGYWAFDARRSACCTASTTAAFGTTSRTRRIWTTGRGRTASVNASSSRPPRRTRPALRSRPVVPRTGFWVTPAAPGTRRRFNAGDLMPDLQSSYGATIWQWISSKVELQMTTGASAHRPEFTRIDYPLDGSASLPPVNICNYEPARSCFVRNATSKHLHHNLDESHAH